MSLDLGDSRVDGPMTVSGRVVGLIDAVEAEFTVSATAHFTCTRCLTEWDGPVEVDSKQYFRTLPDEDGYAIEETRSTSLVPPATSSRWRSPRRLYAGRIAGDFAQPVEPT